MNRVPRGVTGSYDQLYAVGGSFTGCRLVNVGLHLALSLLKSVTPFLPCIRRNLPLLFRPSQGTISGE